MMKHEFEARIEATVPGEDYEVIEKVYAFHPIIKPEGGKPTAKQGNLKKVKEKKMIRLNHCHFPASEISIPEGEPYHESRSCFDGSRRIWPLGRFVILKDSEEVVRGGGDTWTVPVPAGTYEMVSRGSMYSHTIIRRLGDIA